MKGVINFEVTAKKYSSEIKDLFFKFELKLNSTLATANITIVEKIAKIFSVNITDLINHGTVELKNII